MTFTSTPQDFTPIEQGVVFAFNTDLEQPTSVEVEIVESASKQVVATLRLHDIIQAEVNIAPYITLLAERKPLKCYTSTLTEAPTMAYKVRIGDTESPEVVVSVNCNEVVAPSLISMMPSQRRLPHDESDELLIFAGKGASVEVDMTSDFGDSIQLEAVSASGMMRLVVAAADFAEGSSKVVVSVSSDGEEIATLHYDIVTPNEQGVCLAWLSSEGSIERYTFPVARTITLATKRERVGQGEMLRTVSCQNEATLEVASRYEPCATATALHEIVASPRIWLVGEDDVEIDVITSSTSQSLFGKPSAVALTLRLWQKGTSL